MTTQADRSLSVASPYANWGASYRVRVQKWIERTDVQHRLVADGRPESDHRSRKLHAGDLRYEIGARVRRQSGDRILIQKEASRLGTGSLERSLRKRFTNVIFDIDDAVYLPSRTSILGSRHGRVDTILGIADRVIAGNEHLADYCSEFVRDVVLIPSCVEPGDYMTRSEASEPRRLTVGWLGSGSTAHYVDTALPALAAVQKDLGIRVVMIGASGPDVIQRHGCKIERYPWSRSAEASMLAGLDVGIVPLQNTPWEQGKCAYKLLQYGAAGIAPVGSPVGVVGSILESIGAPAVVGTKDWEAALRHLLNAEGERRALGEKLRSHVVANYSYASWQTAWLTAIGSGSQA